MANLTRDGNSFLLDGRRIWIVGGSIHYPRVPRGLWASRIRAAKEAGLNTIETYVFWNAHERRPGDFDFTGNLDLRAFVELVGREGMYCVVRPGPYVCAEWDNGGLPAWLTRQPDARPRCSDPKFLEAASRYLTAVVEQVRDLQITAPPRPGMPRPESTGPGNRAGGVGCGYDGQGGGPILFMQVENEYFCRHDAESEKYNGELCRYLREAGVTVPLNNCNNLWQSVEGTFSTWNSSWRLPFDLRQLRAVQPDAPPLVTGYWPGWFDQWGGEHAHSVDAGRHLYRLAAMLGVGAQFIHYMFHGGTNFGFTGGRTVADPACFMTTSYDYDAPLLEAGHRGDKYLATKRVCTFASQFAGVLAYAEPAPITTVAAPSEDDHPPTVLQLTGGQGAAVFVLRSAKDAEAPAGKRKDVLDLMLPNGLSLPVPLGDDRAAWLLLDTPLFGRAKLDYTNLRPWAALDRRMLVLFGPAGARGIVCLNHAPLQLTVPAGRTPLVAEHEGVTVVVLNDEQVDAAYHFAGGLAVGCAGLDDAGQPLPLNGWTTMTLVAPDGKVTTRRTKPAKAPTAPRPTDWQAADVEAFTSGESSEFQPIDGPMSLDELGVDFGYGWYRLDLDKPATGVTLAPRGGDRLHVFTGGKRAGVLGLGPGAAYDPQQLTLGRRTVVLADNLGRFNYGWRVGEAKGLFGHLYHVKPLALGKPKMTPSRSPDPFALRPFVPMHRKGESRAATTATFTVKCSGRLPLVLTIDDLPLAAMIRLNGRDVDLYHPNQCARFGRYLLDSSAGLKAGRNELELALFTTPDKPVAWAKHLKLHQATAAATEKARWSFAPWAMPEDAAFGKLAPAHGDTGRPRWFRCRFSVKSTASPLWAVPVGMSKGQVYLNGHNVGRYFVATADGKAVPPQDHYYLPEPWLRIDGPNELTLFDEHGKPPTKLRLVYADTGTTWRG